MANAKDGMGLEDFLGHKTRDSSKGNYLDNWKKRKPPHVDTFIHPKSRIIAVWQHPWPKLVEREDKNGKTTIEVWSGTFNSWESEEVLKKQYARDRDTGERVVKPQICPMSLMIDEVFRLVLAEELDWCAPLFCFEGSDPEKTKILHAAGLYNAYGNKNITDMLKAEMKKAGISQKTAWQENMMAKCNYIFTVIDADKPELGAQIAVETTLLGDKVKTVIKDEMTSEGDEQGNPILNPYCIRWVHVPDAEAFGDRYKALIIRKVKVTDVIQAAFDKDAPDVAFMARRGNIKKLRDSMEASYVGPEGLLDFDAIFGAAEELYEEEHGGEEEEPATEAKAAKPTPKKPAKVEEPEPESEEVPEEKPAPRKSKKVAEPEPEPEDADENSEEEMFACDQCDKPMKSSEFTCPHCGTEYNPDGTIKVKEEKKLKTRGAAAAATGTASTKAKASGKDKIDF